MTRYPCCEHCDDNGPQCWQAGYRRGHDQPCKEIGSWLAGWCPGGRPLEDTP